MKSILIGSRALEYWLPEFKTRDNSDWDIISCRPIEGAEWHDRFFLNNDEFDAYTSEDAVIDFKGKKVYVLNLKGLAIIKRSHLWRDMYFSKHITQWHKHLVRSYYTFSSEDHALLNQRIEMTAKAFPQGNPNLNQSVKDFFDDAVTKKYDHDYLHELFAHQEKPMYTKLQTDSSKAWCNQALWNKLSYNEKLQCIAEEAYVISVERFLVPAGWDFYAKLAFNLAVNKICTTLCSGWFRDFAIDNYPEVLGIFDKSKVEYVKLVLERN